MKKDGSNIIQYELLFKALNRKKNCTEPSLLFYYKAISVCLLANQYTSLSIVNDTKTIIHKVVSSLNNKNISASSIKANEK